MAHCPIIAKYFQKLMFVDESGVIQHLAATVTIVPSRPNTTEKKIPMLETASFVCTTTPCCI
jgi:hypothetical protein